MSSQQEADALLAIHQINRSTNMSSVSDILAGIESKSRWIAQDGKFLADYVARLPLRRNFETKAEAAIDEAEAALLEALSIVRQSRAAYNAKPLESSRAA